jgi:hypothetical protein
MQLLAGITQHSSIAAKARYLRLLVTLNALNAIP